MLISQSCDVLAPNLTQEPLVELLHCQPIAKPRNGFRDLQSTRRLDFRPNRVSHPDVAVTAHALADRYLMPRDLLQQLSPDPTRALSLQSVRRVSEWYALRYSRPAWPDEFVSRVAPQKEGLLQALAPLKEDLVQVRAAVALGDGGVYRVAVFFVSDEESWKDQEIRVAVQKAFSAFTARLSQCSGVEVEDDSAATSAALFSLQMMTMTEEWNFAHLSQQGDE